MQLSRLWRPTKLSEVVGQDAVVSSLQKMFDKNKIPQAILLSGASGCGKTTLARIIARKLLKRKIEENDYDFREINAAISRGIDTVREINEAMGYKGSAGGNRVFYLDEAHQLTQKKGGDAQTALLKMLEDPPPHVYFILATTEPAQLLATIRNRCQHFKVKPLTDAAIQSVITCCLIKEAVEGRTFKLSKVVMAKIIECSEGSGRMALNFLERVILETDEKAQLATIFSRDTEKKAIDLARKLVSPKVKWPEVKPILVEMDDEPETVRYVMLAYFSKILLDNGPLATRADGIITSFWDSFREVGKAGLISTCWKIVARTKR